MMKTNLNNLLLLCCCCCYFSLVVLTTNGTNDKERKRYIVYMGELPIQDKISMVDEHHKLLLDAIGDVKIARESRIHSYGQSFNGFVARLLSHEAHRLSQKETVVSVFLNKKLKLYTTRSWDFLGLDENVNRNHQMESDTIVALLDSGVWTESASFNDESFGPPPSKWKGKCDTGVNFTGCNNKIIGARYFNLGDSTTNEPISPADFNGHGTHTASTAAGIPVPHASLFGMANGTARGGVPAARIASYKVCWGESCDDADLLAGFDAAIADGVDIISVSIGGYSRDFLHDSIAIGSFHALKKGILTSCAGGNDGPDLFTIVNVAPWIMTVAASSIDRQFQSVIKLGDGSTVPGISINTFVPDKQMYPLLNGDLAKNNDTNQYSNVSACDPETLDADKVKGKILYCLGLFGQDSTIKELGGVGSIISIDRLTDVAFASLIPASSVNIVNGQKINKYINSTKETARAQIEKTITISMTAPFIASFSSRGPQMIIPSILKPDISAPGLDILAAYSPMTTMTGDPTDKRVVKYNVLSGTSMACPHAASAAAYVKTFRPNWSPAAIKSALMTTAKPMKIEAASAALSSGAGLIDPVSAVNPGLIYDTDLDSYFSLLCKEGYSSADISLINGNKTDCSNYPVAKGNDGLNYPSIHLQLKTSNSSIISAIFYRKVTYIGHRKTLYRVKVSAPKELSVTVVPKTLSFTKPYQQKSFQVTLNGSFVGDESSSISASLVWSDSSNNVTSPILIYRPIPVRKF